MAHEIKRNYWSRFCRKFNTANQYRPTVVNITPTRGETESIPLSPFMGVILTRKGRAIDGIQILTGRPNPDAVMSPVLTIKEPMEIYLECGQDGIDRFLRINSKDGIEARLELIGKPEPDQSVALVEQLAYSMFERRGYITGNDKDDWFEAERKVREAEMELTA